MKCQKCNESFKIIGLDKEHIGSCPKCGERIVPMPNAFESISEAIYYCIQVGSKEPFDILNSKTKLNSYLEDTLGSSYPERNMIKAAIDSDIASVLFKAKESTNSAQKEAFDEAVDMMHRSYGTEISIAEKTVKYFTDAMGWNIETEYLKHTAKTTDLVPKQNAPVAPAVSNNGTSYNTQPIVQAPSPQQPNYNNGYTQQTPVEFRKKKKGHLGFFLILALLLLAMIVFIIFKLLLSNENKDTTSSKNDISTSQNTVAYEIETDTTTKEVEVHSEEPTTQVASKTQAISEREEETEPTSLNTVPDESEQYSIRYLTDSVDYANDMKDFNYQSYCVDPVKELLFYTENDKIYKIDINSGTEEMVVDLKTQDDIDNRYSDSQCHYIKLIYNSFNESVYAFAKVNNSNVLFNIYTQDEFPVNNFYGDFMSFSSENTICAVDYGDGYSNASEVREWDFQTNDIKEGFIYKDYIWNNSGSYLFLQDDDYYWLNIKYNGNSDIKESTFYINHSITSMCPNVSDAVSSEVFGEIKGIARAILENEVYVMKTDFSVYKVNISKLKEISNNNANQNSVFNNESISLNYEDALELYIPGDNIKQTGKNNITNTSNFALTNSGKIIIFDRYDYMYKVIEKE